MEELFWEKGLVAFANWRNFEKGTDFTYRQVQSRFLVWCVSGRGTLEVNGTAYPMIAGSVLLAPWNHTITYRRDPEESFRLGCIHVIPDDGGEEPAVRMVFHQQMPMEPSYQRRRDASPERWRNVLFFQLSGDHPLLRLGRYVIERFEAGCPTELLRLFPRLLCYELLRAEAGQASGSTERIPPRLARMLSYIERHLEVPFHVQALAEREGLSASGVFSIFHRYLQDSPQAYLQRRRLELAARLLQESAFSIGDISRRLCFSSPFYFSRAFKKQYGASPRTFRAAGGALHPVFPEHVESRNFPAEWSRRFPAPAKKEAEDGKVLR